jgi:integrase/recombinase XerD
MENLKALRFEFEDYLRSQRGLCERSIGRCWRLADRFLAFRFKGKACNFTKITPSDIATFLLSPSGHEKSFRTKIPATDLRTFFQFLFKTGRTNVNLSPSIPSISRRYSARPPRYLTAEQVEMLIAAVKTDTPTGRRNHAMVLLVARLGLRAAEVIKIQLDDIDWRSGALLVRGKGHLHDRLPLPADVGEALANYIRCDRKSSSRALFIQRRAPYLGFVDSQIVNSVLKDAFRRTKLNPPAPYVGSRVLRHSLATAMIRRGASLTEIADVLRHRTRTSTMIYAKLDVEGLRSVAQEWPVAGGAK